MFNNMANGFRCRCTPCPCAAQNHCQGALVCPPCCPRGCPPTRPPVCSPGPQGPQGPTGPAGPTAATIPFSISHNGTNLGTDALGNPQIVDFSGFGPAVTNYPLFLKEGEWATGTITFREDMEYGSAFVMPYDAIVRNIHVLFSSKYGPFFESESTLYPFVCLAVSNSPTLVYRILQDTITYAEPYIGGVEYPKHTLRRGSLNDLNTPIAKGTLVGIVVGIRGVGVTSEQYGQFSISGGLFLE